MDTRTRLLLAAEKLFVEHGIDAVSLRKIALEAGQRNVSATHYYFGDRQALITAIFTHRLATVDQRREDMLETLRARGLDGDVWHLTDLLVRPFAEAGAQPGSHYVRFVARLYEHVGSTVYSLPERGLAGSVVGATKLLQDRLTEELPPSTAQYRVELSGRLLITGAADLERDAQQQGTLNEDHLTRLIDAVAGLLAAPATA